MIAWLWEQVNVLEAEEEQKAVLQDFLRRELLGLG